MLHSITVTLRLAPVLPTTVATVQFPNVGAAAEAVRQAINVAGVGASVRKFEGGHRVDYPFIRRPECVELVDDNFMAALNKFGTIIWHPLLHSLHLSRLIEAKVPGEGRAVLQIPGTLRCRFEGSGQNRKSCLREKRRHWIQTCRRACRSGGYVV